MSNQWRGRPFACEWRATGACALTLVLATTVLADQPTREKLDRFERVCRSSADCDDGLFCNGTELCRNGRCVPGDQQACDDGVDCTADWCDENIRGCRNEIQDAWCNNGLFCDGVEICSTAVGGCVSLPAPCGNDCDEENDACVECISDADCDDGIFCNGEEWCVNGSCELGPAVDCDDGIECTVDQCNEANQVCAHVPDHAFCSNGQFCDGQEFCHVFLGCWNGPAPCDENCDESIDVCVECFSDGECDDGLFCNGFEFCEAGQCVAGPDPCFAGETCDENNQSCESNDGGPAGFVMSPVPAFVDELVTITADASEDDVVFYGWSTNAPYTCNTTCGGRVLEFRFTEPGTFLMGLTVMLPDGTIVSSQQQFQVQP